MARLKVPSKSSDEPILAQGLHFVVSTGVEKPNPQLRKFIRSHVMVGKNLGKTLPPRKRKKPDAVQEPLSGSDTSPSSDSVGHLASASSVSPVFPLKVPWKFGSNASTICFADTVEPGKLDIILNFSSIAKQVLFPLESCIFFDRRAEVWIAPLALNPAYLHAMVFTTQYYFDMMRKSSSTSQNTLPHFLKAVKILRERFESDDDRVKLSNTTTATIMALAAHAHLTGNFKVAKNHMDGLCKIVSLRGGVTSFGDSVKLLVEILRCDIGMALHSGARPVFFNNPSCWEPFRPYPDLKVFLERNSVATDPRNNPLPLFDGLNDELAQAWEIMSEFGLVIDYAVESGQRISTETFLDTMASIIYRLLDMHFPTNSNDEVVRLGLLAFSCSVFLPWRSLGVSYPHLTSAFRDSIVGPISSHVSPRLMLWLLMVGAVSVFDETDDEWLRPLLLDNAGLCEINSWSEMKDLLQSFLWIGLVHDKAGDAIFRSAILASCATVS